ncbi:AAA family ATPase Pex1 [Schizosaccharomyces japonicus yFS275]|uniref:Peroxisomal ATPase PEX1 n=1 Tax=Schizosaccharomyces japonicus (strain yFS275 / FY16936) TaxID=402676 RepID=B6K0R0_SCHJY|nr:AAA family ATPase Pex1 [Schizosaccharomyces japonicus yFS275]EEB07531.1 AAA family ATPase Pex1 [Schizosaccharomyces japonicus yFS275]
MSELFGSQMPLRCTVSFKSLGSSLVNVPAQLLDDTNDAVQKCCLKLKIIDTKNVHFLGLSGLSSSDTTDHQCIEIDPIYASSLSIQESVKVEVSIERVHKAAKHVVFEPLTSSDWEIIESNSEWIEAKLLQQARVVSTDIVTIFFPSGSIAQLRVLSIEPPVEKCALLANETELSIAPKKRSTTQETDKADLVSLRIDARKRTSSYPENSKHAIILGNTVSWKADAAFFQTSDMIEPIMCRVYTSNNCTPGHVKVYTDIAEQYKLKTGEFARLWPATLPMPAKFVLHPLSSSSDSLLSTENIQLAAQKLLNCILYTGMRVTLKLCKKEVPFFVEGRNGLLTSTNDISLGSSMDLSNIPAFQRPPYFMDEEKVFKDIIHLLKDNNESVLLFGRTGTGKTVFLEQLAEQLKHNSLRHVQQLDCKPLALESFQSLVSVWHNMIQIASSCQPAVILLDDFGSFFPTSPDDSNSAESNLTSQRNSTLFYESMREATENNDILFIATCDENVQLPKEFHNLHVFSQTLYLKRLSNQQRLRWIHNFAHYFHIKLPDNIQFLVQQTESFVISDIFLFLKRISALVCSSSEFPESEKTIPKPVILDALKKFAPSVLGDIKLSKPDTNWDDIGGMTSAKHYFRQSIEWPIRYKNLFHSCSIKQRTGVLLYGYPGCGKTYLASAIPSSFPIHFLSVKGPELLNKYIGASEQAVRDIFRKAQDAKPCVLFLDEFESIAPRRGSDNTGITDRIVNQFLTQMDGAESLDDVFIVAATSRPDLIDPALLRPGRLDKSIFCNLPNELERLDILQRASKKFNLEHQDILLTLAKETENYSPADLVAIFSEAHLLSVHHFLKTETIKMKKANTQKNNSTNDTLDDITSSKLCHFRLFETSIATASPADNNFDLSEPKTTASYKAPGKVLLLTEHIKCALNNSKPSLSKSERDILNDIYARFDKRDTTTVIEKQRETVGKKLVLQ